jgi:hypothetical protein
MLAAYRREIVARRLIDALEAFRIKAHLTVSTTAANPFEVNVEPDEDSGTHLQAIKVAAVFDAGYVQGMLEPRG